MKTLWNVPETHFAMHQSTLLLHEEEQTNSFLFNDNNNIDYLWALLKSLLVCFRYTVKTGSKKKI